MHYFIIAGERSGDLHGSNLLKALAAADPSTTASGIGGGFLHDAGMKLLFNYEDLALVGFFEILEKLGNIRKALRVVKAELARQKPDALILIDFAGFNLRIAKYAKSLGIKVFYYISPKIWAWNEGRVHAIKQYVDRVLVILPFEKEFYARHGVEVDYVGNPISDALQHFLPNPDFLKDNDLDERPIIALLPGSRNKEIESTLFRMLSIVPSFPEHQFVVAGVDNFSRKYYEQFRRNDQIKIVYEQTYDLLRHAEMAIVTSGTATLETALLKVPQVVVYRVNILSYWLGRLLIKVKYISLVNLIAGKKVVEELIQDDFNPMNISVALHKIKMGEPGRLNILKDYQDIAEKVGPAGASANAAALILNYLKR